MAKDLHMSNVGADEPFAKIGTDEDGPTFSFTGDAVKFENAIG